MVFSNSLRKAINKCSTLREFLRLQIINRTNVVCTKLACFVQNGHGSYKTFPFSVQSGRGSYKLLTSFVESFGHREKKLESYSDFDTKTAPYRPYAKMAAFILFFCSYLN